MSSLAEIAVGLRRRIVERKVPVESHDSAVPSVPKQEIIKIDDHPLYFYPGFIRFAVEWNAYAASPMRAGLQMDVQSAYVEIASLPNQTSLLQAEVDRARVEQQHEREIFDAQKDVPKREKVGQLKRATRRVRRVREDLDRVTHQEQRLEEVTRTRLNDSLASLSGADDLFAFRLDWDGIKFYIAERFRNDQNAGDAFMLRYCKEKGLNRFDQYITNLRAIGLFEHYDTPKTILTNMQSKEKAKEATDRQLKLARGLVNAGNK